MSSTTAAQQLLMSSGQGGPSADQVMELVERYRGELLNQAFAILGKMEDAEDVVQETFCEVLRGKARLKEVRSLGAWLRTINKSNALNRRRDSRRYSDRLQKSAPDRLVTTGGFSALELRESLAKAIETLPEPQRAVVVLRYWENLSYEDIAVRLGIPKGSAGRLLYDASLSLFDVLKPYLQAGAVKPGAEDVEHTGELS